MCLSKSALSCWVISGKENVSSSESSWMVGVIGCLRLEKGSPFAVANLPGNVGDSLGRNPYEGPEQFCDDGGAFALLAACAPAGGRFMAMDKSVIYFSLLLERLR